MIRQDWSTLKKLMFAKTAASGAAAVEATATGNPLAFLTDLSKPLKSLLIPFSDENGVTGLSVWNGGKNLLNPATVRKSGSDLWWYEQDGLFLHAGTYTFSFGVSMSALYVIDKETDATIRTRYSSKKDTFTLTENRTVKFRVYVSGGVSIDEEAQLEAGSTDTAYEPYVPITETDISFPVSAGTPTAGQLDIISGVLTVTAPTAGTYQLTGEQITAIVGNNTLWSDADGGMTAIYLKKG